VVLRVRDPEVSQRFYIELLGARLDRVNAPISPSSFASASSSSTSFPASGVKAGWTTFCLSIRCPDLPALRETLAGRGVPVEGDVVQRRGAYGTGLSLYITDSASS
jgi:hypothetical protein